MLKKVLCILLLVCAVFLCACTQNTALEETSGPSETQSASPVVSLLASAENETEGNLPMEENLPVAVINGTVITRSEWLNVYQSYYYTLVNYYGIDPSTEEGEEVLEEYKTSALDLLITRQLLTEFAQKEGYTDYTQAQRQEAREYVDEYINTLIEQKEQALIQDYTGKEDMDFAEQARKSVEEEMAKAGQSIESLVEDYLLSLALDSAYENIIAQASVTEDEILEYYNDLVQKQSEYTADDFVALYNQTEKGILCYIPDGYILAQHILIGFNDSDQITVMNAYQTVYSTEQKIIDKQVELESAALEEKLLIEQELEELQEQLKTAQSEYEAALETASESIEAKTAEIYEQVKKANAETFEKIALEQSQDAQGSESLSVYLVGEGYNLITEFHDTALSLKEDGDISKPVLGPYGYHIIRRVNALEPGKVPIEEVQEEIRAVILEENESQTFEQILSAWRENGEIKIYTENMVYSA